MLPNLRRLDNRKKIRNESSEERTVPRAPIAMLRPEELATILNFVAETNPSKASACETAKNFCMVSKTNADACNNDPEVWKKLATKIFNTVSWPRTSPSETLIYTTFYSKENPKKVFEEMCVAHGLANALSTMMAKNIAASFEKYLWNKFKDRGFEDSNIQFEDQFDALSKEEYDKLAYKQYPDLPATIRFQEKAEETLANLPATTLLKSVLANSPMTYSELGSRTPSLQDHVDLFEKATIEYIVKPGGLPDGIPNFVQPKDPFDVIRSISDLAGLSIVCLYKLHLLLASHTLSMKDTNLVYEEIEDIKTEYVTSVNDKMEYPEETYESNFYLAIMNSGKLDNNA